MVLLVAMPCPGRMHEYHKARNELPSAQELAQSVVMLDLLDQLANSLVTYRGAPQMEMDKRPSRLHPSGQQCDDSQYYRRPHRYCRVWPSYHWLDACQ